MTEGRKISVELTEGEAVALRTFLRYRRPPWYTPDARKVLENDALDKLRHALSQGAEKE